MYRHLVKTLPIEFTGLDLVEWDEVKPSYLLVSDVMDELVNPDSPFLPDFGIRGYYHYYNNFTKPKFIIDPDGPNILYVSAMPKETLEEDHLRFRVKNPLYLYCWADTKAKYITQVTEYEN